MKNNIIINYIKKLSFPVAALLIIVLLITGTTIGFKVLSQPQYESTQTEPGGGQNDEQDGLALIPEGGNTDNEQGDESSDDLAETNEDTAEENQEEKRADNYTNSVKEGSIEESGIEQEGEESSDEESGGSTENSGEEEEEEAEPIGPTLAWAEEFDGTLNSTYWTVEHSTYGDGNGELQCYAPSQVEVTGGKLKLTAIEQSTTCPNGDVRTVTSGMVRSKNVSFEPGQYIEWSVKLTPNDHGNQGGLWPAFWASGWAGGGWPNGGEWDGFEVMTAVDPTRTVYSLHFANSSGVHAKSSTPRYSGVNFSQNTHTFKFEYGTDGTLVWYRDGYETKRVTSVDTLQGYPAPFDQDMKSFKINLALGGSPGPLDMLALPATYEVGYVRIYDINN